MSKVFESLQHTLSGLTWENAFSLHYWLEYLLKMYEEDPNHVLVELFCIGIIIWLIVRPTYDPRKEAQLSKREEDELIKEWNPDPLVPKIDTLEQDPVRIVESGPGPVVQINGVSCNNFASHNFLGYAGDAATKKMCAATIEKYGVGSCGPRGFYGTIDVHMQLEHAIAEFYGVPEAILYSDGMACVASVIPAFCKRGDLIVCDEGVHFGIRQGLNLSRSRVRYFKHNDTEDLNRVLDEESHRKGKLTRRFIIVEGLYQNHGDVCPLDKVMALKQQYKYRIMIDDSMALGVLGKTGRGSPELFNIPIEDIEALVATLDCTMATVGGFCVGLPEVVDHQRLSGAGYCFSASSPPYTATAGIHGFQMLESDSKCVAQLARKSALLRKSLKSIHHNVSFAGEDNVPLVHLRLKESIGTRKADELFWRAVSEQLYKGYNIIVQCPRYIAMEDAIPEPSLKVTVSADHSDEDIIAACKAVKDTIERVHEALSD
jgi:serine palmitoyltransferase